MRVYSAYKLGQQTEVFDIEEFENRSFDERHELAFEGEERLELWWKAFWRSFAEWTARQAKVNIKVKYKETGGDAWNKNA